MLRLGVLVLIERAFSKQNVLFFLQLWKAENKV